MNELRNPKKAEQTANDIRALLSKMNKAVTDNAANIPKKLCATMLNMIKNINSDIGSLFV